MPVVRSIVAALVLAAAFASVAPGQGFNYPDLGYFTLDEGTGTVLQNTALPGAGDPMPMLPCCPSPTQPYWVSPGRLGSSSLSFHVSGGGAGAPVQTGIVPDYANSFTIELWLRPETANATGTILGDLTAGAHRLGISAPLGQIFWVGPLSPAAPWVGIPGRWYHVALVQDGPALSRRLYLDGALVGSAFHVPAPQPTAQGLVLGDFQVPSTNPQDLPFVIDDVRVWGHARTGDEISIHRFHGLVPNPENQLVIGQSGPGVADFTMSLANVSAAATQGWSLISVDTIRLPGTGPVFGLWPLPSTFQFLGQPRVVGSPFHFPVGVTGVWPDQPFVLPPGALVSITGQTWDFVTLLANDTFGFVATSNLVRVTFQ